MSTFLELCEDVARESGGTARAPTSVIGQTGRQQKIIEWVKTAWNLIQNLQSNWSFLRDEHTGTLVANSQSYSGASFSTTRFGEFMGDYGSYQPVTLYDTTIGRSDESALRLISYEVWKRRWDIGVHDATRPTEYTIGPDQELKFGAKPDKAYQIRFEYRKTPQALALNTDEPDMPLRFHDIIVWRAIMLMADHDEALNAMTIANGKYLELKASMERDLLPAFNMRSERPLA